MRLLPRPAQERREVVHDLAGTANREHLLAVGHPRLLVYTVGLEPGHEYVGRSRSPRPRSIRLRGGEGDAAARASEPTVIAGQVKPISTTVEQP